MDDLTFTYTQLTAYISGPIVLQDDEIEICNQALIEIGETTFDSTQDNKISRLCTKIYAKQRDILLREYPWNFAKTREPLRGITDAPIGWDYSYPIPRTVMRIIYPDVNVRYYQILGEVLVTNYPLEYLVYIRKETNTAKFDPSFENALVFKLAMRLSKSLSDNDQLREQLAQDYARSTVEARSINAMEDGPKWIDSEEWLSSRYMGIAGPTGWLRDSRRYN